MATNNAPIGFMHGPTSVYIAPAGTGTALPEISGDPDAYSWSGGWKLGTAGKEDIGEGGVTITKDTTYNEIRTDGTTAPIKALIDTEVFEINFSILDLSNPNMDHSISILTLGSSKYGVTASTAAGSGTGGYKSFYVGEEAGEPKLWELLLAFGTSPDLAAGYAQWHFFKCYQSGNVELQFQRGQVVAPNLTFRVLQDTSKTANQQIGLLKFQSAAAA